MNDIQVGIGEIVNDGCNEGPLHLGHVFIKALRVDCGLEWATIDYPNVGNCIGDIKWSSIPWE